MKVEGPGQTISSNGPGVNELAAGAVFAISKKRDTALPGPGLSVKARLLENVFYQFLKRALRIHFTYNAVARFLASFSITCYPWKQKP